MTYDPMRALMAAVSAARAYQIPARPISPAQPDVAAPAERVAAPTLPDGETLGRLSADTVSRLIARQVRERRLPP